ncbi:hypothetical protein GOP47_0022556 [Adiantum capillus-veneris]|uniref:Uncharacterized protein n=1 Tax=Adiantum capillus-veneris TaxID=13818 RepID=A0A9D4Z653_ADICA|nr:hypothetical protein GOP47_0022556 [Adiantum capillus-veneris]
MARAAYFLSSTARLSVLRCYEKLIISLTTRLVGETDFKLFLPRNLSYLRITAPSEINTLRPRSFRCVLHPLRMLAIWEKGLFWVNTQQRDVCASCTVAKERDANPYMTRKNDEAEDFQ